MTLTDAARQLLTDAGPLLASTQVVGSWRRSLGASCRVYPAELLAGNEQHEQAEHPVEGDSREHETDRRAHDRSGRGAAGQGRAEAWGGTPRRFRASASRRRVYQWLLARTFRTAISGCAWTTASLTAAASLNCVSSLVCRT